MLEALTEKELQGNCSSEARTNVSSQRFWSREKREFLTLGSLIQSLKVTKIKLLENIMIKKKRKKESIQLQNF